MFAKFLSSQPSASLLRFTMTTGKRVAKVLPALAILASTGTSVHAQSNFEEDFDDREKPWQEIAIQLPAPPLAENLLPFYVSATATQSFAIDAKSLAVGEDKVVRYTLVTTSPAGAKNVSYEGIRCELLQKKLYAFGRADGTWSRSRRDQWEPISNNAANRQHAALAKDYFCDGSTVAAAGKAERIIDRIRRNGGISQR
jgi:hypothetical protein